MIYVPESDYSCYVVRDTNTIRAYKEVPRNNNEVEYRDFYVNSHYMYNDGKQNFNSNSTLPVCINKNDITDKFSYRNDFADILIISVVLIGVVWFLVSKLIKTLFFGFKRR